MEKITRKNVLITGCSSGIGFAMAETLARKDYNFLSAMRNPQKAPALGEFAKKKAVSYSSSF